MSNEYRPEDTDEMIPEQTQPVEPEEEEEIVPVVLRPCMSIDVLEILNGWLEEWNETPETCTEEWSLVAFPVLADGRVALLFESPILAYKTDEDGELLSRIMENHYRVLVFDPKSGEQVGKYRFKVFNGYATTVFFKGDRLYAAVSPEGECQYTALQMWPGSDDENQIWIGEDINCLAVTEAGDIIVSYNGGDDVDEEDEPYEEDEAFEGYEPFKEYEPFEGDGSFEEDERFEEDEEEAVELPEGDVLFEEEAFFKEVEPFEEEEFFEKNGPFEVDKSFEEEEEEVPPLISVFCADGGRRDIGCFYDEDTEEPSDDYVIDVTLDGQERIWAMLSDEETAVMYDKDGSLTVYSLPVSGVSALAVPDDCSCLYASSRDVDEDEDHVEDYDDCEDYDDERDDDDDGNDDENDSYWLFRIPMTEDDEEDEEPEICAIQTPEGNAIFTDGSSFLKNIMAALIDGVIYVIDLNEQ